MLTITRSKNLGNNITKSWRIRLISQTTRRQTTQCKVILLIYRSQNFRNFLNTSSQFFNLNLTNKWGGQEIILKVKEAQGICRWILIKWTDNIRCLYNQEWCLCNQCHNNLLSQWWQCNLPKYLKDLSLLTLNTNKRQPLLSILFIQQTLTTNHKLENSSMNMWRRLQEKKTLQRSQEC